LSIAVLELRSFSKKFSNYFVHPTATLPTNHRWQETIWFQTSKIIFQNGR